MPTNRARGIKDGISTETEGLVVLGRRLSIQDSGDKLLRLPILEGAAVDAGLLAHFKRIRLAVREALLLARIRQAAREG